MFVAGTVFWTMMFLLVVLKYVLDRLREKQDLLLLEQEMKQIVFAQDVQDDHPDSLAVHSTGGWFGSVRDLCSILWRLFTLAALFTPLIITYPLAQHFHYLYDEWWCPYLVHMMRIAGPCFIKLGQWIGTRPDLFSDTLVRSCSTMHTNAPGHSFKETRAIIEGAYGMKLEDIFTDFTEKPIASGAIAQIHIASLRSNKSPMEASDHSGQQQQQQRKQWCAIKVRHPGVEESISRDLRILNTCAKIATQWLPSFHWIKLDEMVRSFSHSMQSQTDLRKEARNLIRFNHNFRHYDITFPRPVPGLVVHPSVLCETYESGTMMTDVLKHLNKYDVLQRNQMAQLGIDLYLKMLFIDNFIHADLHPGNLMLRMATTSLGRRQPQFVVLDAGLVTELSETDKRNFLDLFAAVVEGNGIYAAELMVTRARNFEVLKQNPEVINKFKFEMSMLIQEVLHRPLQELEVGQVLSQVLSIGRRYQVQIEPNFTTIVIGTIVIEGLGKTLNPNFEFIKAARPYLVRDKALVGAYVRGQLSHGLKNRTFSEKFREWLDLLIGY